MTDKYYCARPEYFGVCDYRDTENKCDCGSRCGYQVPIEPQLKQKPQPADLAKQECSICAHSKVCKFKEEFENLKGHSQPPFLCVCQFYTMIAAIAESYNEYIKGNYNREDES